LLTWIDDIASVRDDVAHRQSVATVEDMAAIPQMAAKKTAGVLC
jgi:predicted DNA repair protein MutK